MIDPRYIVELSGKSYPLYAGVLQEAHDRGLKGIDVQLIQAPTAENENVAIVKATVIMKEGETFTDYGDASPRNTSARLATALIRFASTRAKGRALRDAISCGQTLLEELPDDEAAPANGKARAHAAVTAAETHAVSDRVTRPTPPAPKPPADPAPGFEAWFEAGGKKIQRVSMISACLTDISMAQERGLPMEPFDTETATNEQLYTHGRNLRQRLKAAKDARESEGAQAPGVPQ